MTASKARKLWRWSAIVLTLYLGLGVTLPIVTTFYFDETLDYVYEPSFSFIDLLLVNSAFAKEAFYFVAWWLAVFPVILAFRASRGRPPGLRWVIAYVAAAVAWHALHFVLTYIATERGVFYAATTVYDTGLWRPDELTITTIVLMWPSVLLLIGVNMWRVRTPGTCENCGYPREPSIPVCPECGLGPTGLSAQIGEATSESQS